MSGAERLEKAAELHKETVAGFLDNYGLTLAEVETLVNGSESELGTVIQKYLDAKASLLKDQAFDAGKPLDYDMYLKAHALFRAVALIRNDFANIRQVYSEYLSELAALEKPTE